MSKKNQAHEEAVQAVLDSGRALGAAAVIFHTAVAEKQGITAIEEKAIDLLQRFGPLTAGELGQKAGLAPPSVTGLINRLEKKRFVTRVSDSEDGRRIRVQVVDERLAEFIPLFTDFVQGLISVCGKFTAEELRTIDRFNREAAQCQLDAAGKLATVPDTEH